MSKASVVPPVTPRSARDPVRNSVLQVRNYAGNDYAKHLPPSFQRDQDYDDEVWARPRTGYSDHEDENGGWRFGLD